MKPLLIFTLSLSFTLSAIGQALPDSGFTDKAEAKNLMVNGLKEGKWIEYLDEIQNIVKTERNSMYYRLTIYKKGKQNGIVRVYLFNGKLFCETTFTSGKRNGIQRQYNDVGLLSETSFSDDKMNGVQKWFYNEGELEGEVHYFNNIQNGTEKHYYKNGNLKSETIYTNGVKGISKKFDETGNEIKK
jgi:antitoxin component YwqK of YwqJK toxin-antitoxin module